MIFDNKKGSTEFVIAWVVILLISGLVISGIGDDSFDLTGAVTFSNGSGTEVDPYKISNCTQLQNINSNLSAHYELVDDIDCSDTKTWNGGKGFKPIGVFNGIFQGNAYSINDLFIDRSSSRQIALFSENEGYISNLTLSDVNVTGETDGIAGLVGINRGNVSFVGVNGRIKGTYSFIGGVVGRNQGNLTYSYSNTSVEADNNIGSLSGENTGVIISSYSHGSARGSDYGVGGLVGTNDGFINGSYSTSKIEGAAIDKGGLIGINEGSVNNSFWDVNTSGQSSSAGGAGKTTSEMMNITTFESSGWNITSYDEKDNIWYVLDGESYPNLWWESFDYVAPDNISSDISAVSIFNDVLVDGGRYSTPTVLFENKSQRFFKLSNLFNKNKVNLKNLSIYRSKGKIAVNTSRLKDSLGKHILFVSNINKGVGVRVCPDATSLSDVQLGCNNELVFKGPFPQSKDGVKVSLDNDEYVISGVEGSGAEILGIDSCQDITEPGSYKLVSNISSSGDSCIRIKSSNVSLDGAGYEIKGDDNIGVRVNGSNNLFNVSIKDLTVSGESLGIKYEGAVNVSLVNVTVTRNEKGVLLKDFDSGIVKESNISSNEHSSGYLPRTFGLKLVNSDNNVLINNDLDSNNALDGFLGARVFGIFLDDDSDSNRIVNNTASFNYARGQEGARSSGIRIRRSDHNLVLNNIFDSNNAKARGYNKEGTSSGVIIDDSFDVNISDSIIKSSDIGMSVRSSNAIFDDNRIISNKKGFRIRDSNTLVDDNNISMNKIGAHISSSNSSIFSNNSMDNKQSDVYLHGSMNQKFFDNDFSKGFNIVGNVSEWISHSISSNSINGKKISYLKNSNNISLSDPNKYGQVIIMNSSNIGLSNQDFINTYRGLSVLSSDNILVNNISSEENLNSGALLKNSSNISLTNSEFNSNSEAGIKLINSNNNLIYDVNTSSNNRGVVLSDSDYNNITKINARGNSVGDYSEKTSGIRLDNSHKNNLYRNDFINNRAGKFGSVSAGIKLVESDSNTLVGNNASSNSVDIGGGPSAGIIIKNSDNNVLFNNIANSNKATRSSKIWGVRFSNSNNNSIINLTASFNKGDKKLSSGFSFYNSYNNSIINISASQNNYWSYISSSSNNEIKMLDVGSTISFTGEDFKIDSASVTPNASDDLFKLNNSLEISSLSSSSFLNLKSYYHDEKVDFTESTLRIWRYNGSSWRNSSFYNSYGVNISEDFVFANITRFSSFSVMGSDITNPSVFSLAPVDGSVLNVSSNVSVGANVTDNVEVDSVFANISYPNGTSNVFVLTNESENRYNLSFSIPDVHGSYEINFIANDSSGNVNDSEFVAFDAFDDSVVENSSVENSNVSNSTINDSNITNSEVLNSLVDNSTLVKSTKINSTDVNSIIKDSFENNTLVVDSNISNSYLQGSKVNDSTVSNSSVIDSNIQNSSVVNSTKVNSTNIDSSVINSFENNSVVTNSTVNDSSVVDSLVDDSILINSSIINSDIDKFTLLNAIVNNSKCSSGSIVYNGLTYDCPISLSDVYRQCGDVAETCQSFESCSTCSADCGTCSTDTGDSGGGSSYCNPDWECTEWSSCKKSGVQTRECNDLNNCEEKALPLLEEKPREEKECSYSPTCSDDIMNGNESDVDCGGGKCNSCSIDESCRVDSDCSTGNCLDDVCRESTVECVSDSDCESGVCSEGLCESVENNVSSVEREPRSVSSNVSFVEIFSSGMNFMINEFNSTFGSLESSLLSFTDSVIDLTYGLLDSLLDLTFGLLSSVLELFKLLFIIVENYNSLLFGLLVLIITSVAVFNAYPVIVSGYHDYRDRLERKRKVKMAEDSAHELLSFIFDEIMDGKGSDEIKDELVGRGWSPEVVTEYVDYVFTHYPELVEKMKKEEDFRMLDTKLDIIEEELNELRD